MLSDEPPANGTKAYPFKTIKAGITKAEEDNKDAVFVRRTNCDGCTQHTEQLVETSVSIYGGYTVYLSVWSRTVGSSDRTTLVGSSWEDALTVVTGSDVTVEGLDITGPVGRGTPRAIYVDTAKLAISNCVLSGGLGQALQENANSTSTGIAVNAGTLVAINNDIYAGASSAIDNVSNGAVQATAKTWAVYLDNSNAVLLDNLIDAGQGNAWAGYNSSFEPITNTGSTGETESYGVFSTNSGSVTLIKNEIAFGIANSNASGSNGISSATSWGVDTDGEYVMLNNLVVNPNGSNGAIAAGTNAMAYVYGIDSANDSGDSNDLFFNTVVVPGVSATGTDTDTEVIGVKDAGNFLLMANNIVDTYAAGGNALDVSGSAVTLLNNDLYANTAVSSLLVDGATLLTSIDDVNDCTAWSDSCLGTESNITVNPDLDGSWALNADSECVDTGTDPTYLGYAVGSDYFGTSRPQNSFYDIGASELEI